MKTKFFIWLAHKLPKIIIYYCANELLADVTSNELSNKILGDVTGVEALGVYLERYKNFD